ncbi:ABC1 kinase family protein [Chondromyces apiculatus]|uniref:Ubiquinone biosynthesis monooxygenase UbiB n=1 Tax=Chondromyces apiculatus DSM 436 TaxID=1192034 RepID=A0A017SVX5_9BACT|nr:AarF/ABC1/UbiB kinase family protein [Chondromyces apiculatus]EYF00922.1 Ubiquinone biosynthesis monooxygenase UbiB [Chondromyces apiculatus DSM 436]
MTNERKLPEGRLGRLVKMAGVGARTGASLLLSRDGEGAAQQAAEVLGTLRGLAAKAGQMVSYVDGLVPETHRVSYETALRTLRTAAPTSSPAAIRAVVEEDLGAPIGDLFARWEEEPFASASIGQVHRATLVDGRDVAVKVQHPGIARAVESDLENASVLQGLVGALAPRELNTKAVLDEVKMRFREELDYTLEATRQAQFRALFAGDPEIHVPAVIEDRVSRRVLTAELVHGISLEDAATHDVDLRRRWAETLWRFVFTGNLVGGMFNADPHPGNYLFRTDGTISFLDFGCVQPIEGERMIHARGLHTAARERDEAAFARWAKAILATHGGRYEELAVAHSRRCFEPLFSSPFRITRDFVASLVNDMRHMKDAVLLKKDSGFVPLPSGMLFMNRLHFGFYSVLARLDVEVDYAAVEARLLEAAGVLT